jgi:hypothetical protein
MPAPIRLLCALLTLLLALPAMQANACAPAAGGAHATASAHAGHEGHHDQAPEQPSPEARHECVGCIPPIDIGAYRPVEGAGFTLPLAEDAPITAFPAGRSAPPEPPPPRFRV